MKAQKGFTLIELVVVIVVLGVLALAATPRFLDIYEESEMAAFEGITGAFTSGTDLVRGRHLVDGKPDTLAIEGIELDYIAVSEGKSVKFNYPVATDVTECQNIFNATIKGVEAVVTPNERDLAVTLNRNESTCEYRYKDVGTITYVSGQGDVNSILN